MTFALYVAVCGLVLQSVLWFVQQRTRNAATIDVGWSLLVCGGAVGAAVAYDGNVMRRVIVAALVTIWAGRLAAYLVRDRVVGQRDEDGRYRSLRERWGNAASRNFLLLYLAQVPIAGLFLLPIVAAMRGDTVDAWMISGIVVWCAAIIGESVADKQLEVFRTNAKSRGAVCRTGLWAWSRHPNYFFEWLHWFAYVLIGHATALTWIGPVVMLLFLFRVTGIPYTERQAVRSRGDAYRAYQRSTSVFFPLPPKHTAP